MTKWEVKQWGDGSQRESGLWNVFCPEHEAYVISDIPKNKAEFLAETHNAELAVLKAQREWVNANEEMPPEDVKVLWLCTSDVGLGHHYRFHTRYSDVEGHPRPAWGTHWQYLPPAP